MADKTIEIAATTTENEEGTTANLSMTNNDTNNEIENKKGTQLPSTCGIGTTIFYVIGTILVIGAGVILVTHRRMGNAK